MNSEWHFRHDVQNGTLCGTLYRSVSYCQSLSKSVKTRHGPIALLCIRLLGLRHMCLFPDHDLPSLTRCCFLSEETEVQSQVQHAAACSKHKDFQRCFVYLCLCCVPDSFYWSYRTICWHHESRHQCGTVSTCFDHFLSSSELPSIIFVVRVVGITQPAIGSEFKLQEFMPKLALQDQEVAVRWDWQFCQFCRLFSSCLHLVDLWLTLCRCIDFMQLLWKSWVVFVAPFFVLIRSHFPRNCVPCGQHSNAHRSPRLPCLRLLSWALNSYWRANE